MGEEWRCRGGGVWSEEVCEVRRCAGGGMWERSKGVKVGAPRSEVRREHFGRGREKRVRHGTVSKHGGNDSEGGGV